jgi:hypothetical protein
MLEWTGERFLPWLQQSLIAYDTCTGMRMPRHS